MIRHAILLLLAALCLGVGATSHAAPGSFRASTPEVKQAIVEVIEAQFAAFRKGDVAKAYGYAAAELRAQKPLRTFSTIVKESYPEIWKNVRAEFGIVRDDGAKATVTVQVFAKDGDAAYDFILAKENAGWRIYGVTRHEPKQAGKV